MKKIDIHCHTTNRPVSDVVPKSADIEALLQEMDLHEVGKTVLLATYFPHKASGISNFRLLHWIKSCSQPDRFLMFGSLDFEHYFYQGINELTELAENKIIRGIKIYTSYQQIDPFSDKMHQVAKLAAQYRLPLMFHGGESYTSLMKYGKYAVANLVMPAELEHLSKDYGLDLIISHLCTPFVKELIEVVKRNDHIYSDVSGVFDSYSSRSAIPESIEEVKLFLGECGPEKLLFGTDFPVMTHEDAIMLLEEGMKNYSSEDKQRVYYDNARRLLKC
ncbi:MAG: amidohydrolase family protein [Candidatus Woesearchaeota archaeon]|jgi:hypothetical protein